jgi:hypothetical protein
VFAILQATDERSSSRPRELTITSSFWSDIVVSFSLTLQFGVQASLR